MIVYWWHQASIVWSQVEKFSVHSNLCVHVLFRGDYKFLTGCISWFFLLLYFVCLSDALLMFSRVDFMMDFKFFFFYFVSSFPSFSSLLWCRCWWCTCNWLHSIKKRSAFFVYCIRFVLFLIFVLNHHFYRFLYFDGHFLYDRIPIPAVDTYTLHLIKSEIVTNFVFSMIWSFDIQFSDLSNYIQIFTLWLSLFQMIKVMYTMHRIGFVCEKSVWMITRHQKWKWSHDITALVFRHI